MKKLFSTALTTSVVASLLFGATAHADQPKYTRDHEVKVNVAISDRVKPTAKNDKPDKLEPSVGADTMLSIEGLVGEVRKDQIRILEGLIEDTPDTEVAEKTDYYFRLAEIYAKMQRYARLRSAENSIKADNTKDPKAKKKFQDAAAADLKEAQDSMVKAVKTYKALTENKAFKNFEKMPEALFYYGYTLQSAKYFKEARAVYDRLLNDYPDSKYVPEAHLAFADYYFEVGQLADAEARYKMVMKFPQSPAYLYAKYKLGWVNINLQKFEDAMDLFFQVSQATANDKKNEVLNKASKKDFVRAYSERGKPELALQAFERVDKKESFKMLGMLGDHYVEQGKSAEAIYVFRLMIKTDPANTNVCLWQYDVAHMMLTAAGAKEGDKIKEIENLVKMWSVLRDKKALPAAEAGECHDNAAAMSGELARAYHSEAAKTLDADRMANAERLYHVYLDTFQDATDFAETQYFYSELQWKRAEIEKNPRLQTQLWEDAAVAFTNVVKAGKVDDNLKKEAAYAAVLAWKNALNVDPRVMAGDIEDEKSSKDKNKGKQPDKDDDKIPDPVDIPEREQKMLAAFDVYIQYIKDPNDKDLVDMKFFKARTYWHYNHFDEAIPLFQEIVDKHPAHPTAEFSANILLDIYNRTHKYTDMLAFADKLAKDEEFLKGKDTLREVVTGIKRTQRRKIAEQCEKDAKDSNNYKLYTECGQMYLDIFNDNTEADDADVVLYNAGVNFQQGKSLSAAISMFNNLSKLFPTSPQTAKAIARLGFAYGGIAYYKQAAEKLEEYAKKYGKEKDSYDAMSDAVFYRKGIGDDDKAIEDTTYFVSKYGKDKPAEAAGAFYSLVTIYEKQGNGDAVVDHLRKYLKAWGEKGGGDKVVIAYAKIGKTLWDASCPVKAVNGSCFKITRERAVAGKKTKRRKGSDLPTQCGEASKIKTTVVTRDEKKVKEAIDALNKAVAEYEKKGGKTGGDDRAAQYYYAQAKMILADKEFEAYVAIKFPTGLDFDPNNKAKADKSKKRFDEWIAQKTKSAKAVADLYDGVLKIKDAANSIAAAARLGQVSQNLSDQLFTAEIPQDVRTGEFAEDKVDAYCDQLTVVALPLQDKSTQSYSDCLAASTKLGWFSEWSKMCEAELGQIQPDKFPTASELKAEPDEVAPVTDIEAATVKLQ